MLIIPYKIPIYWILMEMSKFNELSLISAAIFPQVNFSKIAKTKHFTLYSGFRQQPRMQHVQKTMHIQSRAIICCLFVPVDFIHICTCHNSMAGIGNIANMTVVNHLLTHWGRDTISQLTYSDAFFRMKMNEIRLGFHWGLFLRFELTIFHHWFR